MLRQGTMVLSRLLILPFLLAILIGLDVYKTYEVPDRTISLNGGDVKGLNRSGLPKSPIFFLPCGISLLFNIAVVFASFQEWSWAYSHKDRRRLQLASYYVYIIGISVTEFAMYWPGFCDSSVWILIGWIYSTSRASTRRCRDMSFGVFGIYFFFNMLGLIWNEESYVNIMIDVNPSGLLRALQVGIFMLCVHIVFRLAEESSRASHKLKDKFDNDTKNILNIAENAKELLSRVLPKELIPRVRKLQEGSAIADIFENVTIIFAKIIGLHEMFDTLPTVSQ